MSEQRIIKPQCVKKLNEVINHDLIYDKKVRILAFEMYDDMSTAVVNVSNEKLDYIVCIHINLYTFEADHEVVLEVYENDQYPNGDEVDFQPLDAKHFSVDKLFTCLVNSDFNRDDWCCEK